MNYIQAYFHLPLAIVYKEDKSEYFTALQEARKQEKVDPFYNFILQQYQKFLLHEMQQFRLDMNKSLDLKKKDKKGNDSGFSLFF
jgi:hypothetical protein